MCCICIFSTATEIVISPFLRNFLNQSNLILIIITKILFMKQQIATSKCLNIMALNLFIQKRSLNFNFTINYFSLVFKMIKEITLKYLATIGLNTLIHNESSLSTN